MTTQTNNLHPTDICLHKKSRLLAITFSDGAHFQYPCEYLRVKSNAAEVRALGHPEAGKEQVNITDIKSQGTYAIRLIFDDGHDTGIYSWQRLYDLGMHFDRYWQDYLNALKTIGYIRHQHRADTSNQPTEITILYFVQLPDIFGTDSETLTLPQDVTNVTTLLAWLRSRGKQQTDLLKDDRVTVTINKSFAKPFTLLEHGDEVAIVPKPL